MSRGSGFAITYMPFSGSTLNPAITDSGTHCILTIFAPGKTKNYSVSWHDCAPNALPPVRLWRSASMWSGHGRNAWKMEYGRGSDRSLVGCGAAHGRWKMENPLHRGSIEAQPPWNRRSDSLHFPGSPDLPRTMRNPFSPQRPSGLEGALPKPQVARSRAIVSPLSFLATSTSPGRLAGAIFHNAVGVGWRRS
jgi:hypothetical protein